MAPKYKFTKEEMVEAALRVVRTKGIGGLTAKTMADELGTSTQPIFTSFGSMEGIKREVYAAAVRVYDGYTDAGLKAGVPFFGVGMQYIRFAREEPELYRLLFLSRETDLSAIKSMEHLHHRRRSRPLFPGPVAGGAQPVHADRDRRLPLFRPGNRQDSDELQHQHLQIHQGNTRVCSRRLRPRRGLPGAGSGRNHGDNGAVQNIKTPDAQTQCRPKKRRHCVSYFAGKAGPLF